MSEANYNPSPKMTGAANASIVLGVGVFFTGGLTGAPAVFHGHKALSRIRKNPAIQGYGRALAGTILGYLGLAALVLIVLGVLLRV